MRCTLSLVSAGHTPFFTIVLYAVVEVVGFALCLGRESVFTGEKLVSWYYHGKLPVQHWARVACQIENADLWSDWRQTLGLEDSKNAPNTFLIDDNGCCCASSSILHTVPFGPALNCCCSCRFCAVWLEVVFEMLDQLTPSVRSEINWGYFQSATERWVMTAVNTCTCRVIAISHRRVVLLERMVDALTVSLRIGTAIHFVDRDAHCPPGCYMNDIGIAARADSPGWRHDPLIRSASQCWDRIHHVFVCTCDQWSTDLKSRTSISKSNIGISKVCSRCTVIWLKVSCTCWPR